MSQRPLLPFSRGKMILKLANANFNNIGSSLERPPIANKSHEGNINRNGKQQNITNNHNKPTHLLSSNLDENSIEYSFKTSPLVSDDNAQTIVSLDDIEVEEDIGEISISDIGDIGIDSIITSIIEAPPENVTATIELDYSVNDKVVSKPSTSTCSTQNIKQCHKSNPATDLTDVYIEPDIIIKEPMVNRGGLIEEMDLDDSVKDPDWQPNSGTEDDEDGNSDDIPVRTGEKRRTSDDKSFYWKKKVNKRLRMEGKKYKGLTEVDGQYTFTIDREERKLRPRECTDRCKKLGRKCNEISEESREGFFKGFWNDMNWEEKRVYVCGLVESGEVKERTTEGASRRQSSFKYYLKYNNQRYQVCKSMFLSTLCLGEKTVYQWKADCNEYGIPAKFPDNAISKPARSTPKPKGDTARDFLNDIPKLPSHYCRSTSTKLYLEPTFSTRADIYKVYRTYCESNNKTFCGRKLFFQIFDEMNLSLYVPKKDQCDTCIAYQTKNISEEEYNSHIEKKEAAREEKGRDKERALEDKSLLMLTLDLQALLMCPKLEASALYYKTKLGCHNYTIFNVATRQVKCYFWFESEGDLTANSFASCLSYYLEVAIDDSITEVIIYTDGCTYQNRNLIVSQALLLLSRKKNIVITQKILERGHTQMECDSIHSVIERAIKRKPIYSPQNYVDKIREARPKQPYEVEFLTHEFFKEYSKLKYYNSIRPGTRTGEPVVTDLRVIRYNPDGVIEYKLNYGDEFSPLPRRAKIGEPSPVDEVPQLHEDPLPIKKKKYGHLQELKVVIPKDYHTFYDNLPHEN
ncbi:hypothetical protein SNE40_008154 [Patella caerulea]|uniref:Uncharacterized protein n=1 Tax=Patella caerulea TaxID=87958 RepID=A0AAN8PUR9_PATCE